MFLYCACVYIYIYSIYMNRYGMVWPKKRTYGSFRTYGTSGYADSLRRYGSWGSGITRGFRVWIWVLQLEPRPYMYYIYTHNNYIYNIILYCKYLYLYANTNIYSIDTSYPSTHLSCLLQRCLWSLCPILPGHRIFGVTVEEELVAHVVHNHILRARGVQLGSSTCSKWT